jgi:hypothetical protein
MAKPKKFAKKAQQAKKQQAEVPVLTVDHGTSATRKRLRGDPVDEYAAARRHIGDRLAGEKETAAREIRCIYGMITAGLWAKAVDMDGVRGRSEPAAEWLATAHRDRYKPWADEMGRKRLPLVIDWLVEEKPMMSIDRERRQRNGTAAGIIDGALLRYAELWGSVGRVVRAA